MEPELHDHSFKILLVGNSGVGKSSLVSQYVNGSFSEDYKATVGVGLELKTADHRGLKAKLWLYDTSGMERYHVVINSYYRDAHAVLVVYDVTAQKSFDDVGFWLQQVDTYNNNDVCKILVGNKIDSTESRVVDTETAKTFALQGGLAVHETSAKTGENVAEFFDMIVGGLMEIHGDLEPHRNFFSKPAGRLKYRSVCCSIV